MENQNEQQGQSTQEPQGAVPKVDNSALRKEPMRTETIVPKPKKDELIPEAAQVTKEHLVKDQAPQNPQTQYQNPVDTMPKPKDPNLEAKIQKKLKKKQSKKLFTLISLFLFTTVGLFMFAFFLIYSVTDPANNPFIRLFGLEVEEWIPFLINLVSVFFVILILISFFVGVIGIFKVSAAPKDNKVAKNKGIAMSMMGSMFLIVFVIAWMFTYIWLDGKRAEYADFSAVEYILTQPEEVTGLTAPMVVKFDASPIQKAVNPREKKILSYVWNFGDGSKLNGPSVAHEYTAKGAYDGSYQVTLTVRFQDLKTGEEGTQEFYKTIVFDNEKVAAAFNASATEGAFPLEVEFDGSESADPDGSIIEYLWDMDGDGDFDDSAGVKANYTFNRAGEFNVRLKVVDDSNDYAIKEQLIKVTEPVEAKAVIDVDAEGKKFYIGETYTFDASGSTSPTGTISKYRWDFGDGDNPTTRTVTKTFDRLGTYLVILEVEDTEKLKSTASIEFEVIAPDSPPRAVISPTPGFKDDKGTVIEGTVPLNITFSAAESSDPDDDIVSHEWDFDGDGIVDASGEVASYSYNNAGEYTAVLHVIDAVGNKTSQAVQVMVGTQGLIADLTAGPIEGEVPMIVTFDASGSSYADGQIISYKWDFGDGSKARFDDSQISYEYSTVGEFNATVLVKADDGSEKEADVLISVRPIAIRACFDADNESGIAPLEVEFSANCSTGTITQYSWKVNGITRAAMPPHRLTHEFTTPGDYEVELIVRDNDGVVDTFIKTISITE